MKIITLFILLVLFNLIDAGTTTYIVQQLGVDAEVNPFMKWVIIQYGIIGMFAIKVFFPAMLYAGWLFYRPDGQRLFRNALYLLCTGYGLLCVHNIYGVYYVYSNIGST